MLNNPRAFHQVMRDAKRPTPHLDKLIHQRLKKVLTNAYLNVPFYRVIMSKAGYDPTRNYRGIQDLELLPIITKDNFRQNEKNTFIKDGTDLSNCFCEHTSGSTGVPLAVYRSPYERSVQIAKWLRVLFLNGYSVTDKVLALVNPLRLEKGHNQPFFFQRLGFLQRKTVDYTLPPARLADILLDTKPSILYGNRSHLDLVALELKNRDIKAKNLKIVAGTGEVIPESSRILFKEYFGVQMVESYGSVEMGVMAYDTPERDGLHLCEDLTFFEFLDKENNPVEAGKPGRVVVTDLSAKLMPLIRYDHLDHAVFQELKNESNRPLKRLTKVIGRHEDFIPLSDGTKRSLLDLTHILQSYIQIYQFQVVQISQSCYRLFIATDKPSLNQNHDKLIQQIEKKFSGLADFKIFPVRRIEPDLSGKIKRFIPKQIEKT